MYIACVFYEPSKFKQNQTNSFKQQFKKIMCPPLISERIFSMYCFSLIYTYRPTHTIQRVHTIIQRVHTIIQRVHNVYLGPSSIWWTQLDLSVSGRRGLMAYFLQRHSLLICLFIIWNVSSLRCKKVSVVPGSKLGFTYILGDINICE